LALGILAGRLLALIVDQATPREPLVLGRVAMVMLSPGLPATWIPARRALSVDPLRLLRIEWTKQLIVSGRQRLRQSRWLPSLIN